MACRQVLAKRSMIKTALICIASAAAVPASTPIAAGRWLVTNQIEEATFDGKPDPGSFPKAKPHAICLAGPKAARGPGLAFSDPSLCTTVSSALADGAFAYELRCRATESDDTIRTKASGRYTADSYTGASTSVQYRGATRIEMRSSFTARRVGTC